MKRRIADNPSSLVPGQAPQAQDRAAREELQRQQMAAIGTAAALLAHQIKNPLNGISTTIQLLDRSLRKGTQPSEESLRTALEDLQNEIGHLQTLLRDFQTVSNPQQLNIQPLDLAQLAHETATAAEAECKKNKVEISVECGAGLTRMQGDPEKLKLALSNLINNGCRAMPQGGSLAIHCYPCGTDVCVDVTDSGEGIPQGLEIFDLFTSTKSGSTGLGLVIVQQVVLAHGGSVSYSSAGERGTTFSLRFPVSQPPGT